MRAALLAASLLSAAGWAMSRRPPQPATLAQIEDRERVADQKKAEGDPSASDEYRVAIGQAAAAAASAAEPLRDALLLLESPPAGPGFIEWHEAALRVFVGMTPDEREELKQRVEGLSDTERDGKLRWYSSSGPRDFLLQSLPGALDDWRGLRAAEARLRAHCGDGCL